uniref:Uncharacterized protein n=1 Tax=Pavo cristatus TaxID=9049 RepID=A0A8C9FQY9_PAVCR
MVAPAALRVVRCGGSAPHGTRAVFSVGARQAGRFLLCASGDFVKMYSVATEELVRLLRGHGDLVTGVQLAPHNHLQVGYQLLALYALPTSGDSVFVIIPKSGERGTV